MEIDQRFWDKVHKTHSCWFWTGYMNPKGYGKFNFDGRKIRRAHVVSWFLRHGRIPNKQVLHSCDTPQCVNPNHLFLGSNGDNRKDSVLKGTHNSWAKSFRDKCKRGHRIVYGQKECRDCRKETRRAHQALLGIR